MNKAMTEGKRRYNELRQSSPEFRAFISSHERASVETVGKSLNDERKYALALSFRADEDAGEQGKQRFVDAAVDALEESIAEAKRGVEAIKMCRQEGKGGHALAESDLAKLEYGLTTAAEQAKWVSSKIEGEQ